MKIPEPLFVIVNVIARSLLRSPLHILMSKSVLVISYTGRKSGRKLSTPVRYARVEGRLRCLTAEHTQWWRNLQASPSVTLLVEGNSAFYSAEVLERDPKLTLQILRHFLDLFPQDAAYQDIRINPDKSLNEEDLLAATHKAIVVEFQATAG
jgi:deazaflavin-dependent oxidoreductase (nitroreductase family)